MEKLITSSLLLVSFCIISNKVHAQLPAEVAKNYKLAWEDNFDYNNKKLDDAWESQNGPSGHILCSRWRENAVVKNGVLHLENRKEKRGGQDWTSGSIWTKKRFTYGYFECRYKYAGVEATNNSFWLMTKGGGEPKKGKRFEIDINEGHYPNEVNTNIHNWSDVTITEDGKRKHYSSHKAFAYGAKSGYSIQLEIPVSTNKIRFQSNNNSRFHIGEFRVYGLNDGNYPDVLSKTADTDIPTLENLVASKDVKITSSGSYKNNNSEKNVIDGNPSTRWATQDEGEKWLEFEWNDMKTIGCIQFLNGWQSSNGDWHDLIKNYKIQYLNDGKWKDISVLNVTDTYDFSNEYHTYGLLWNEDELVFYFDGEEIRRENNEFSHSETPIWLSLAIIKWAGPVTDAIDGTSMKVDYVKYYQHK